MMRGLIICAYTLSLIVCSVLGSVILVQKTQPTRQSFVSIDAKKMLLELTQNFDPSLSEEQYAAEVLKFYEGLQIVLDSQAGDSPIILDASLVVSGAPDITPQIMQQVFALSKTVGGVK